MLKLITLIAAAAFAASGAVADDAHHPGAGKSQGAQGDEAMPMMGMMGGGMMGSSMMPCQMMSHGKPYTEGHIAFLKAELKITSQQEKTWTSFANAIRGIDKRKADMMAEMGSGKMEKGAHGSAPEALQMHVHMMESMLENLKAFQAATANLYGALSGEQKAVADELLTCCMGHM